MHNRTSLWLFLAFIFWYSCKPGVQNRFPLPILGNYEIVNGDTVYHRIPDFRFIDQDSNVITNDSFAGRIYVADFFFTSCPSICPKVKKEMLRMYEKYQPDPRISFLSHSIDTKRDTVGRLKEYATNLGVESRFWHFVTGNKSEIFRIANDYFVSALEDPGAPGGFDHSGRLILVDKDRHVRAFCNGTVTEEVDHFMEQIDFLLETEY
jgi:protein SCO1/2